MAVSGPYQSGSGMYVDWGSGMYVDLGSGMYVDWGSSTLFMGSVAGSLWHIC